MSGLFGFKPFERVTIDYIRTFKDALRERRDLEADASLSKSTIGHTADRCGAFFRWFNRQPDVRLQTDLPGYFRLSRKERRAQAESVKGTILTFDQAVRMFRSIIGTSPIDLRNRAIFAMFMTTDMRIAALISLRGKHVNVVTRWIDQDHREVDTKNGIDIRTYCLDLRHGLLDALAVWARWRVANGFRDADPFFLPNRNIQPNAFGLGFRAAGAVPADCWRSGDPVERIIKDAATAAGLDAARIASHDVRKVTHPFLARRRKMTIAEEVALKLNFGHKLTDVMQKHY
jgi:integrase